MAIPFYRRMARRRRRRSKPPELAIKQILAWADEFRERMGKWPGKRSGPIPGTLDETWKTVDEALRYGGRSLPYRSSLAQLLAEHRGVRNRSRLPPLSKKLILSWADAHHRRTGKWPNYASGKVVDAPGETWLAAEGALRRGCRGLPGGSSLARVLAKHRGVRNIMDLLALTYRQILAWADAHHRRTGKWPNYASGKVIDAPGETWNAIEASLRGRGHRGLPGGSSLARLLAKHRGVRNILDLPPLTKKQILAWSDAHKDRTGKWPMSISGPVVDAPGETWKAVDSALDKGFRGLPGGWSLARLLQKHRGKYNKQNLPSLSVKVILQWADGFHQKMGKWPTAESGAVAGMPGQTWLGVDTALKHGSRGLPGGTSLGRLLAQRRGSRNPGGIPRLTPKQVLRVD